jgi:hypothetical protein
MKLFKTHKSNYWFLSDSIAWRVLCLWGALCASYLFLKYFGRAKLEELGTIIPVSTVAYLVGMRDGRHLKHSNQSGNVKGS